VFRGEDGRAHALDAYCCHNGANLAVGGLVKGSCVECPFHGWLFRGDDGKCTHIPYCERSASRSSSCPLFYVITIGDMLLGSWSVWHSNNTTTTSAGLTAVFHVNRVSRSPRILPHSCAGREPLGIRNTEIFTDRISLNQQCQSIERNKETAVMCTQT